MKLEEIEKLCEPAKPGSVLAHHILIVMRELDNKINIDAYMKASEFLWAVYDYMPKLLKVAKAAKEAIEFWDNFGDVDIHASERVGTRFDPRFKPAGRLGLKEALEELEKD